MIASLDQLSADPASTVISATGHQMTSLCKAVCEEEKAVFPIPWWEIGIFTFRFQDSFRTGFLS